MDIYRRDIVCLFAVRWRREFEVGGAIWGQGAGHRGKRNRCQWI